MVADGGRNQRNVGREASGWLADWDRSIISSDVERFDEFLRKKEKKGIRGSSVWRMGTLNLLSIGFCSEIVISNYAFLLSILGHRVP
jgi:hypothetical protein